MSNVIKVGIVGFGRSGFGIHANGISGMPEMYTVCAIADPLPERRTHEKFPNARPYDSIEALLQDPEVELVVVASLNYLHARHALMALNAGKHVLCEKPFGFTTDDVDAMIAAAKKNGKILQPFQQRRYEEDFNKVKEICQSGLLGRITHVKIAWDTFARRWDWQTSRKFGGGQLYNNMPHLIDYALELFGPAEPEVFCTVGNAMSSGDAEDEVQVMLRAPGAPVIEGELLATAAYPPERWNICGTAGGMRGNTSHLEWKWVDWKTMPERPQDLKPTEGRTYNSEKITWQNDSWDAAAAVDAGAGAAPSAGPVHKLYAGLYRSIREGRPQEITPESVRRRIAVLQRCYELNNIPFPTTEGK